MSETKFICKPCNKAFPHKSGLERHLNATSAHVKEPQHECEICHNKYQSKNGLAQHHKINHDKILPKRRPCSLCDKSFSDGKGLKGHLINFHGHGEKSHKCGFCGMSFVWVTSMNKHIRATHLREKSKDCKICFKKFAEGGNMRIHCFRVHNFCVQCDITFESKEEMRNHQSKVHQYRESICKFCKVGFPGKLSYHYKSLHFYCSKKCDKQFESRDDLMKHLEDNHPDEAFTKQFGGKRHTCKFCKKTYSKTDLMDGHYKLIHQYCRDCDISCSGKEEMILHLQEIHQIDFTCSICQKVFLLKKPFNEHMRRIHNEKDKESKEKPHQCDICSKMLSSKSTLQSHIDVIHRNIKATSFDKYSFSCDKCDFKTKYPQDFKRHVEKHEGTKTKCDICDKSVWDINKHKKKIHIDAEAIKQCLKCDFKGRKLDLQVHFRKEHTTKQLVPCDICGKKFGKKGLTRHKKFSHLQPEPKELKCGMCDRKFNKVGLKKHKKFGHKKVELKVFKCESCDYIGHIKANYQTHLLTHQNIAHKCDQCDYTCKSAKTMEDHRRSHLPIADQLKCPDCSFFTHSKSSLQNHKRKHLPEDEITCEKCSYIAASKQSMRNHELTYHKEKLNCHFCDFTAWSVQALQQHRLKTHKSMKCDHCDYTSSSITEIKKHTKVCEKIEERYVCEMCDKQYSTSTARAGHIRKDHTKENDIKQCEFCAYQSNSSEMEQHVKDWHSFTKCEFCDHEAKEVNNVRKHMRACKDIEERYICKHCGKQYSTVQSRALHIKQKH